MHNLGGGRLYGLTQLYDSGGSPPVPRLPLPSSVSLQPFLVEFLFCNSLFSMACRQPHVNGSQKAVNVTKVGKSSTSS